MEVLEGLPSLVEGDSPASVTGVIDILASGLHTPPTDVGTGLFPSLRMAVLCTETPATLGIPALEVSPSNGSGIPPTDLTEANPIAVMGGVWSI